MASKIPNNLLETTNPGDVFSSVAPVPTAEAEILKSARMGIPEKESTSVSSVVALVNGVLSFKEWWNDVPSLPSQKTLKAMFKQVVSRRKVRARMSDEPTRTIPGRSAPQTFLPYDNLTKSQGSAGGLITVSLDVVPVYADGTYPETVAVTATQSQYQETSCGVTIVGISLSLGVATLTFSIDPTATDFLEDSFDLSSDPLDLTLIFSVGLEGDDRPISSTGTAVDLSRSVSEGKATVVVDLS